MVTRHSRWATLMHASSLDNMQWCRDFYVSASMLERGPLSVLDVGAADWNGGYSDLFRSRLFEYRTADIDDTAEVDLVMASQNEIPAEDGAFDIVISGQMLEHAEFFWQVFEEMARVLADDGLLFLIAPSAGPIHRCPVDCYRFYPDSYRALAKLSGLELIHVVQDERGPWNDLVGIFARCRVEANESVPPPLLELQKEPRNARSGEQAEVLVGDVPYREFLHDLHEVLHPQRYLEIGVRAGASLALAKEHAVGVDPAPAESLRLADRHRLFRTTSTDFFRCVADNDPIFPVDLAFIDGLHRFENVLADFIQIERRATPTSVIVIDDVFPNHSDQAARTRRTRCWTGDVWNILPCLAEHRPELILIPLSSWPTGCLMVAGLQPKNRTLAQRFNPIVRKRVIDQAEPPPASILKRRGAYATPDRRTLHTLFNRLKAALPADRAAARSAVTELLSLSQ